MCQKRTASFYKQGLFFCIVLSSLLFFLRAVNMSFKDNPCRKFQANIFNKSKCQNCFKPRESHLLNDEDLNQVNKCTLHWLNVAWIMDYEVDHGVQKACLIEYNCFLAPGLILTLIHADGSKCSTVCCLLPQNDHHLGFTRRCRCCQNSIWVLQMKMYHCCSLWSVFPGLCCDWMDQVTRALFIWDFFLVVCDLKEFVSWLRLI